MSRPLKTTRRAINGILSFTAGFVLVAAFMKGGSAVAKQFIDPNQESESAPHERVIDDQRAPANLDY